MPKNVKKQKKGEKQIREIQYQDKTAGLLYAIVLRRLGGDFLEVLCSDKKVRKMYIRGIIRNKVWLNQDDIVLISIRRELTSDEKCDYIQRYDANTVKHLKASNMLGFIPETESVVDFEQVEAQPTVIYTKPAETLDHIMNRFNRHLDGDYSDNESDHGNNGDSDSDDDSNHVDIDDI